MKQKIILFSLSVGLWFCVEHIAYAETQVTQVGRYITMENKPNSQQIDLLSQIIAIRFPQNIQSVGDAVNYLLQFSGYILVSEKNMNADFKNTLSKQLPLVDRSLGPMTLKQALTTLIGPAFYLVHDPVNRTINFRLKKAYQNDFKN